MICFETAQASAIPGNKNLANNATAKINASDVISTTALPIIKPQRNNPNNITLDFQNADVKYVLRAICQFAGYNLVMSDTVQGIVTIKLEDIKWDQALQLILQIKNLGYGTVANLQ